MFDGQLENWNKDEKVTSHNHGDSSSPVSILYLNASHGPKSLIAQSMQEFWPQLSFPYELQERNLLQSKLIPYGLDHVTAKMRLIHNEGTPDDKALFQPVLDMADELNRTDILVIGTPMWNFSVPYILKQYIDISIQPGINFLEKPLRPVTSGKSLVIVTSCGGTYRDGSRPDFLGPYLKDIFHMVGFERAFEVNIQGAAQKDRTKLLSSARLKLLEIAANLGETNGRASS
ncbi:hypothetical protein TCAL_05267 [Tigriopus californicus]|uniref:Flavodoxin-like fold domain-containing protein n=2 Tax=Tigriopus californicus TaxID=6832 RepID=A0A553NR75_TIGCA|nr:hypothetical protein TCAL_05267 [Tigriopus californicus]|eukprot:TCALIF_05267-PA protein Name:"Similar to azoR FMN-dependent NADH-azoreductase (Desulfotalea psychrophila (strain LSv54 / DSM 12343))" AED:0.07 eAED:0.07 QI:0/-1/0/1/-1/1/1/0/230